jgi:transposase
MKIATEEIRHLVVKAYLSGAANKKQLSEIFGYTVATIRNWLREYGQENRLAPLPRGHRQSVFTREELDQLVALLNNNVDMTLAEIREYFNKTCSLAAIHKIVKKLGFVYKKNTEGKRTRTRGHCQDARGMARIPEDGADRAVDLS